MAKLSELMPEVDDLEWISPYKKINLKDYGLSSAWRDVEYQVPYPDADVRAGMDNHRVKTHRGKRRSQRNEISTEMTPVDLYTHVCNHGVIRNVRGISDISKSSELVPIFTKVPEAYDAFEDYYLDKWIQELSGYEDDAENFTKESEPILKPASTETS